MAEMTVAGAVEELKPVWISDRSGPDTLEVVISVEQGRQISALIEQQAQEIVASEQKYKNWIGPIEHKSLLDEIAKKDRMIELACKDHLDNVPCKWCAVKECESCVENWRKWLEKEAEGVE